MSSTKWPSLSPRAGGFLFLALAVVLTVAVLLAPRTPQPLSYHDFADQRPWLGIPNFGDVASNIPFALIGVWGLLFLASSASAPRFRDAREKIFYFFIFAGLLLTARWSCTECPSTAPRKSGTATAHRAPAR